jgi:hypothetical protein
VSEVVAAAFGVAVGGFFELGVVSASVVWLLKLIMWLQR